MSTGMNEQFGREGKVACRPPIEDAAMQQHLDGGSGGVGPVDVHRFNVRRSVGQSPWRAQPTAHRVAVDGETTNQLRQVGCGLGDVERVVQILRVHVIQHDRTLGAKRSRAGSRCFAGVGGGAANPTGQGQQGPSPTGAGRTFRLQGLKVHVSLPSAWRCSPGSSWVAGQARS